MCLGLHSLFWMCLGDHSLTICLLDIYMVFILSVEWNYASRECVWRMCLGVHSANVHWMYIPVHRSLLCFVAILCIDLLLSQIVTTSSYFLSALAGKGDWASQNPSNGKSKDFLSWDQFHHDPLPSGLASVHPSRIWPRSTFKADWRWVFSHHVLPET